MQSLQSPGSGTVKLLFLGQCTQLGYTINGHTVTKGETFPQLARRLLVARYPALHFEVVTEQMSDPVGLVPLLRASLPRYRPDILVLSLAAAYAVGRRQISYLHAFAPELVQAATPFMRRVQASVASSARLSHLFLKKSALLPGATLPPLGLDEYERLIVEVVEYARQASDARVILMGPGRFNEDTRDHYARRSSPEHLAAVNRMVFAVGERFGLPVIDTQGALGEGGSAAFLPDAIHWSRYGQELVAREVEAVIAAQVAAQAAHGAA
jgi:hypothetical protein